MDSDGNPSCQAVFPLFYCLSNSCPSVSLSLGKDGCVKHRGNLPTPLPQLNWSSALGQLTNGEGEKESRGERWQMATEKLERERRKWDGRRGGIKCPWLSWIVFLAHFLCAEGRQVMYGRARRPATLHTSWGKWHPSADKTAQTLFAQTAVIRVLLRLSDVHCVLRPLIIS